MQSVSQAWKDEQKKKLVGESFVDITLNVGDPESQADAVTSDNGSLYFSDTDQLTDKSDRTPTKCETLEANIWRLDGSFLAIPDSNTDNNEGFISSDISDGEGIFSSIVPTITISFSKVFSNLIPGITLVWSNTYKEYAKRFMVTSYNGNTINNQVEVENDGEITSVVYMDINEYDKIVVEVLEWCLPNRRARIESISVGIVKKYTKTDLINFSHSSYVDPLSAELPKNEITFEITNLNGEYNPDNPVSSERYIMERQPVEVRYGYKINGSVEWIPAGTFYMSGWDSPQNGITASFTARDALEYMTDAYSGTLSGTLYDIASAAFEQADLPSTDDGSNRFVIDDSLSGITVPSEVSIGESTTIAEILQYVANAGCCVFYQNRNGIVHIEPIGSEITDYIIDGFVSYKNAEVSLNKQLKAVNVNNGQYILNVGPVGVTQTVNNPLISDEQAPVVAEWIANYLQNRQVLNGSYRADPRLDALDRITNVNQFAEKTVLVTEVIYSYSGAFRGSYTGRAGT